MQRRQMRGDVEAATNAREAEMFLLEFHGVSEEIFEGVVLRIDRPNDFIHGASEFASGAGNLANMGFGFAGAIQIGAGQFAEQSDLGEAGSKVVMNVFGDAGAFAFDSVLLFQQLHALLKLPDFDVTNRAGDGAAEHQNASG